MIEKIKESDIGLEKFKGQKWLILTQYYPPEVGAPQIRLRSMTAELLRHGIDVNVLTAMPNYPRGIIFPGYEGKWSTREVIDNVPVKRVWIYAGTGKSVFIRLLNYFSFTFMAFIHVFFGKKPDLIFLESQPLSLGIIGVLMKWVKGVPYVYNVPDLQVDVAKQMGFIKNEMFLKLAFALENLFLKQAFSVSTVTHLFIEHFEGRGLPRKQISFLPNGADTYFLKPMPADTELLERWPSLKNKQVILYVGTHAYYHGLETLIYAAKEIADSNRNDLHFLMVGNGPERKTVMDLAQTLVLSNITFGQSPYEEMGRLYSLSCCSVATLKNIEVAKQMRLSKIFPSLACGVPVVYAGLGEAADVLRENDCGVPVVPENPKELARELIGIVDDDVRRNRMSKNGQILVENEYSWKAITRHWLNEISNNAEVTVNRM